VGATLIPEFRDPLTPIPTSRCWKGWSRCAAAPACISAAPTRKRCITIFAEVLDNAMDEAVAGHATRIEVELQPGNGPDVRDNGRGIPVDPHPKFKNKSALEVIMTTLHAGGKFDGGL
jgi:DNA gyrase/topoisomerase IV subunit B